MYSTKPPIQFSVHLFYKGFLNWPNDHHQNFHHHFVHASSKIVQSYETFDLKTVNLGQENVSSLSWIQMFKLPKCSTIFPFLEPLSLTTCCQPSRNYVPDTCFNSFQNSWLEFSISREFPTRSCFRWSTSHPQLIKNFFFLKWTPFYQIDSFKIH